VFAALGGGNESGLLEKIRSGQPGIEPCPIPLSPRMARGIERQKLLQPPECIHGSCYHMGRIRTEKIFMDAGGDQLPSDP
jgi:hypothetical protein